MRNLVNGAALVPDPLRGSQTMLAQPRRRRQAPDLVPPRDADRSTKEEAVVGGFTPKADGGNEQHPIHDEDQEDAAPDDYEREIDRLDEAVRARSR
jgi:hypothetical protein